MALPMSPEGDTAHAQCVGFFPFRGIKGVSEGKDEFS